MMVKIKTVNPPEQLLRSDKQSHVTKQDCTVADATGSCRLVLWAGRVGAVKEGESYHVKSIAVRQYKNQIYMSALEHMSDFERINDIGPVNDRCVNACMQKQRLQVKSTVYYRLSNTLAVQSATQKCEN
jgi:hypothetical protein